MWTPGSGQGSDSSDAGSSGEEGGTDGTAQIKRGGSQLYRPAAMNPYCQVLQPAASQPQPLTAVTPTPHVAASAASMPGAPRGAHHQRAVSVPSEQELEAWRKRQDAAVAAAAARRRAAEATTAGAEAAITAQAQGHEVQPASHARESAAALKKTVSSVSSGSLALHAVAETPGEASAAAPTVPATVPAASLKQGVTHDRPAITRWLSTDDIPPPPGVSLGDYSAGPATEGPPAPSTKSSEVRDIIRLWRHLALQTEIPASSAVPPVPDIQLTPCSMPLLRHVSRDMWRARCRARRGGRTAQTAVAWSPPRRRRQARRRSCMCDQRSRSRRPLCSASQP